MTRPLSSLPAWPRTATVDPAARSLALIGIGAAAAALVGQWRADAEPEQQVWSATAPALNPVLLAELDAELSRAVIGWRLMIAGDEAALGQLRSRALAAGAEPAEVQCVLTAQGALPVYCVHCARLVQAMPDERKPARAVQCPQCRRRLEVRPHFSPELGGYLGVCDAPDGAGQP